MGGEQRVASDPSIRKVFGNLPWPQILKLPKSFYQVPSGALPRGVRRLDAALLFRIGSQRKIC